MYELWMLKNKIKFELKVLFYYLPKYLIFKRRYKKEMKRLGLSYLLDDDE
ncbi:MAG: hypothetical protein K5979_12785 [Ruminococcus sp.]|nr:hypothetical protein [Ruminococcus sp.]